MLIMKCKREKTEGIEQPNQKRIRMLGKKENEKYLRLLERTDKEKLKQSFSEEREKFWKPSSAVEISSKE